MRVLALVFSLFALPLAAHAEVANAGDNGFLIQAEAQTTASPADAWRALTRIERWWSGAHTYSGEAARLSLDPRAGGCWCERWRGGQVEHGRVVMAMEHEGVRTLRVVGALGPLQGMGAHGVLTFVITPHPTGANIAMTYRVSGEPGLGLGAVASVVDGVITEQFGRLIRFSAHGSPN